MSLAVALASILLAAGDTPPCDVNLLNSSPVDLSLTTEGRTTLIAPGESKRIPATSLASIAFGAIDHSFSVAEALKTFCDVDEAPAEIEARVDGKIWLRGVSSQPVGLPLEPVETQDLTLAPPNNSFKPSPLRGLGAGAKIVPTPRPLSVPA